MTAVSPRWLDAQHARADEPPRSPRQPLWAGAAPVGSVEPGLMQALLPALAGVLRPMVRAGEAGWALEVPVTQGMNHIALALREAGLAGAWRNEQLAGTDAQGRRLGTVERAAVRPLGITTFAVHLAGRRPDGGHWVQRRALDKPNDPGLWDTLMGGMVSAADTLQTALARETQEEAGLPLQALQALRHGGRVTLRRPSGPHGYMVEHVDWFGCTVPEGVVPANQDDEVEEFRCMSPGELRARLEEGAFTLEAGLVLCAAGL